MDLTGEPDGPPQKPGVAYADLFTGLYGTIAVLAALRLRARTGRGQWIDLALFDTQLAVLANQATNYLIGGRDAAPHGQRPSRTSCPTRCSRRPTARWSSPAATTASSPGSATALGLALHRDPRFARNRDRVAHRAALVAALAARIGALPRAEVLAAMEAAGVPAGPINTVAEAFADPQAVARGMVQEIGGSRSAAAARCASPTRSWRRTVRRRGSTSTARRSARRWRRARRGRSQARSGRRGRRGRCRGGGR